MGKLAFCYLHGVGFCRDDHGIFREILFLWKITYAKKNSEKNKKDPQQVQRDYFNCLDDNNPNEPNRY